jgi:hypothetical protein
VATRRTTGFVRWRRERPFWGAVLIALGGIEEFFSGQLDVGKIHIQLGLEGLQALVIPAVLVLLAVLIAAMPVHRVFYGVIALLLSLYSLIGVNLGGFVIGMLLSAVGGVVVVAWMPKDEATPEARDGATDAAAAAPPAASAHSRVLHGNGHAEPVIPPGLRRPGGPETATEPESPHGRQVLRGGAAAAAAATVALALAAVSPQPAGAAEPSAVQSGCVLFVICTPSSPSTPSAPPSGGSSSSAPSPTPSSGSGGSLIAPGPGGTTVQIPGQGGSSAPQPGQAPVTDPAAPSDPTTQTPLAALGADNDHGVFTTPSSNSWGDSLQISGPSQVGVVTVPLANGGRATAIRISCEQLTIGDFHLDTKNRHEVVDLNTGGMTLSGHAVVWIDRIGTQYGDGEGLDQSLAVNPLTLEALMTLLGQGHTVLGLVGAQADELSYSSFEETASLQ